jgi:hypothetical protein
MVRTGCVIAPEARNELRSQWAGQPVSPGCGADHGDEPLHDDLAAPDRDVDVLEDVQVAEPLVHVLEDDQGVPLHRRSVVGPVSSCEC